MSSWTKKFVHRGVRYEAIFLKRPFREGLEVSVLIGREVVRVAELGLGEKAILARLKVEIDRLLKSLEDR